MSETTLAVVQLAPTLGAVEANRTRMLAAVEAAAAAGAEIIVLPELATTGYCFTDAEHARALAEPLDGPTVGSLVASAARHDVIVVAGLAELGRDGELHNSAVLVDATGLRATYRKAHLWGREAQVFRAGDQAPDVVETRHGGVALLICYDLEFAEWVRRAALDGADLICAPVNWPAEPRPHDERPIEVVTVQASAAANRVFIAASDRTGDERGTRWVGGSVIAGPDGYPLALAEPDGREQTLVVRADLTAARDKSVGRHNDRFRDRRPQLYP